VNDRERFLRDAQSFVSRHLDQHQSAETTSELEVAALLIMLDVSLTRGLDSHNGDLLQVIQSYVRARLGGSSAGACSVALQRLAFIHSERTQRS